MRVAVKQEFRDDLSTKNLSNNAIYTVIEIGEWYFLLKNVHGKKQKYPKKCFQILFDNVDDLLEYTDF
jgi:hypothetical protein